MYILERKIVSPLLLLICAFTAVEAEQQIVAEPYTYMIRCDNSLQD